MCTAEKLPVGFHSVTHDLAVAMAALGRQRVNRTFEAVEGMATAIGHQYLERLVVPVAANFTDIVHPALLGLGNCSAPAVDVSVRRREIRIPRVGERPRGAAIVFTPAALQILCHTCVHLH
jgi:hypothetical protein